VVGRPGSFSFQRSEFQSVCTRFRLYARALYSGEGEECKAGRTTDLASRCLDAGNVRQINYVLDPTVCLDPSSDPSADASFLDPLSDGARGCKRISNARAGLGAASYAERNVRRPRRRRRAFYARWRNVRCGQIRDRGRERPGRPPGAYHRFFARQKNRPACIFTRRNFQMEKTGVPTDFEIVPNQHDLPRKRPGWLKYDRTVVFAGKFRCTAEFRTRKRPGWFMRDRGVDGRRYGDWQ
jgi:hypothetical protein